MAVSYIKKDIRELISDVLCIRESIRILPEDEREEI